uniref:NADH-ubiquinone oxidoreductase chain 6 n=1 Tax=Teslasena femoralis TaxID=1622175 RepID=A0A0H3UL22_9COLE|nr:NADH dehydrogenase subunit 6 [Teslasena femoralis]
MTKLAMLSLMSTTLFMFTNHPLSMGLTLLLQTLTISLITGNLALNFWYSYIIFIVMVGGVMVLFLYMMSVASNEKFKFSFKATITMMFITPAITIILFKDNLLTHLLFKNQEIMMIYVNNTNFTPMSKYFNFPSNMMMIFLMIYLLMTLIAVVKITNIQHGPLRQKN